MAAVGRGLIADPDWVDKVRAGALADIRPFEAAQLAALV
jgi:2,4-dienoyl-CoA reductase-like NADH-dependent reductase (Old Yellow Enzyme family)